MLDEKCKKQNHIYSMLKHTCIWTRTGRKYNKIKNGYTK